MFILTVLFVSATAKSQTDFIWGKMFGSEKDDYVLNHVIDKSGNIYVAGKSTGIIETNNFGKNDGFLTKTDSSGNVIWSRQFGTSGEEDEQWCAIDKSSNIYITGSTTGELNGTNKGKEDIFVVKYNQEGHLLWSKQFGTEGTDVGKGIYADNAGNVYITGFTEGKLGKAASGKMDCFILKIDSTGNQLFVSQFGTPEDDYCYAIAGGSGSDIIVCGSTWGNLGGKNKGFIDCFTGQFKENGDLIKFNQFGSDGFDIAMILKMDNDKNIYVGGSTSGNFGSQQAGEGDAFLLKLDQQGEILWNKQFGTINNDGLRGLAFNPEISDNILVSGIMNLPPAQAFIRMYKNDGTLLWQKNFLGTGGSNLCSGKDVNFDNNGDFYTLGLTGTNLFGNLKGVHNYYIAKFRLDREYRNK